MKDHRQEAREIRAARQRLGHVSRGNPHPAQLRARIVAYVEHRCASGVSRRAACAELGVAEATLVRWTKPECRKSSRTTGFLPVVVSEPASAPAGLEVRGPCGLRIAGLSLEELAELLRRLA